jgi:hypothetical protein
MLTAETWQAASRVPTQLSGPECPANFFWPSPKDSAVSFVSIGECPENRPPGAMAIEWNYYGSDKAHAIVVLDGTGRETG